MSPGKTNSPVFLQTHPGQCSLPPGDSRLVCLVCWKQLGLAGLSTAGPGWWYVRFARPGLAGRTPAGHGVVQVIRQWPAWCLAVVLRPQLTHALFSRWQCVPQPGGACSCLSWDPLCLPLLPLALHFNLALATGKPSRTGRRRCW